MICFMSNCFISAYQGTYCGFYLLVWCGLQPQPKSFLLKETIMSQSAFLALYHL